MSKKKILIIEDEGPLLKALSLKLAGEGYDVKGAADGEDGLKQALADSYDLILLDLILPKMSGFDVLKNIKGNGIKTPVIVSSNLSQNEDVKRVRELGAVDYIIKSNTPLSEIVQKVKKFLE